MKVLPTFFHWKEWPLSFRGTSCFDIKKGSNSFPNSGDKVTLHITAYTKSKCLRDEDIEFVLGDYENIGVPIGLNEAVERHGIGSEFYLWVDIDETFTAKECKRCHIPENTIVYYYVKIIFVEAREKIDPKLPFADFLKLVQARKSEANEYFKVC